MLNRGAQRLRVLETIPASAATPLNAVELATMCG
jgi:hypothetical protein